jgi:hypothetical protein
MKTGIGAAVAAVAMLPFSTPSMAQDAPKPAITAELVSRLCPVSGMPGLKLGATREEQPPELLRILRRLPASFKPFTEAELETTSWSGKVAAITYRAASPDGDVNDALLEGFDAPMIAAGWEPVVLDRTVTPLSVLGGRTLEREILGPDGSRKLLLEFDASGALALRCGDPALLELDQRERDGTLEPGSPRPVAPAYDPALRLPEPSACQSPALQRLTVENEKLEEEAPELVPFLAATTQESDRAQFGKRLGTWLEWKLLGSGKVDDNRLVALRTAAAKSNVDGEMRLMMQFLAIGGELAEARERGDALKSCEGLRKLMAFEHDKSRQQVAYWDRVNAALEAEAKRLGIGLEQ